MKRCFIKVCVMVVSFMALTNVAKAEEPEKDFSFEATADVVSSYIWRGQNCGKFSIQPGATLTWEKTGLSLGAWASLEPFEDKDWGNMAEFDLSLAWEYAGLTLGLTDYNFCTGRYFADWNWSAYSNHFLETNIAYDFGPLAIAWNTVLTGADHTIDSNGKMKRNYSTYVEVTAPWKYEDYEFEAAVGASLWDDTFTCAGNEKFNVYNVSLKASRKFFNIPFYASVIASPKTDKVFFVVGLTLSSKKD